MKMNVEKDFRLKTEKERLLIEQVKDFLIKAYDDDEILTSFSLEESDGIDFPDFKKCVETAAYRAARVLWRRDNLRSATIFHPRKVPAKAAMFVKIISKKTVEETYKNGKC